ncbi:hypothetical protein [Szabonella alba]|uniref:DUF1398 domain-containing protein n=1 Tax=Szabonella alba TaxID=2804194 RepID=A0A8K0Y1L1_9RHOB|nr:hypothetical protein [Szabonella alba]MBL4918976.1 hypothetical protein [Szabonella alba]
MDADQIALAETCLQAAHDGSLGFPQILGRLIAAGFEGYSVDYRQNLQTFFLPSGEATTHAMIGPGQNVAERFDPVAIEGLVRWAQSGAPDYSYAAFSQRAAQAGCAGYLVSFPGRRVLYFGRSAETHVEHFPS